MGEAELVDYEALPLKYAYEFLTQKGLEKEMDEIRTSKDTYKAYGSTLRRGKIVDLLETHALFDEFIEKYWNFGKTDKGKSKIRMWKRIYSEFMGVGGNGDDDEKEQERIEETSFAYEADLRDYLASNLSIIEKSLKLYNDGNGRDGIEYPVDDNNKRIDILAIDKDGNPVVIELKVSKGYEKVIGQCLYYKSRVKSLLNSKNVRVVIIAREITSHLKLATEDLPGVELFEYKLSVQLDRIR